MAKTRNKHIYGTAEYIKAVKEDYDFSARNATRLVDPGHLIVLALPPKRSKPKDERKPKPGA